MLTGSTLNQQSNRSKKHHDRRPRGERPYRLKHNRSSEDSKKPKYIEKKYNVLFFDSFPAAKSGTDQMKSLCQECDQLNVVIKAEGNMDDQDLLGVDPKVKIYAGEAWTLIHERRRDDGWYNAPQRELQTNTSQQEAKS